MSTAGTVFDMFCAEFASQAANRGIGIDYHIGAHVQPGFRLAGTGMMQDPTGICLAFIFRGETSFVQVRTDGDEVVVEGSGRDERRETPREAVGWILDLIIARCSAET